MKCISCNSEINTKEEKCANCGHLVKDTIEKKSELFDKEENKTNSYSKDEKSSKTSKKDLIILMIILAVFIITNPSESDHEKAVFKKNRIPRKF